MINDLQLPIYASDLEAQPTNASAGSVPVATFEQAETFLRECLKPEEISGKRRMERITELMHWFDRFTRGSANGKWFKAHAYELCYFIATQALYAVPPADAQASNAKFDVDGFIEWIGVEFDESGGASFTSKGWKFFVAALRERLAANAQAITADHIGGDAKMVKRGTDVQIEFERRLTCESINRAMALGHVNTNTPPEGHWLAPYWKIGRKQAVAVEDMETYKSMLDDAGTDLRAISTALDCEPDAGRGPILDAIEELKAAPSTARTPPSEGSVPVAIPEKIAPVQGYTPGIPWSLHLEAYDAYSKKWAPQPAMIDLEGRNCRGGFSTGELDLFIPGWRDRVPEIGKLKARVAELEAQSFTAPTTGSAPRAEPDFDARLAALPYEFPETGVQCGWNAAINRVREIYAAPASPAASVPVSPEVAKVLTACIRELKAWMKDHGQDLKSMAAIDRANALLAAFMGRDRS